MKKMDQLKNKKLKSELITAKREISSLKKTILKLKERLETIRHIISGK